MLFLTWTVAFVTHDCDCDGHGYTVVVMAFSALSTAEAQDREEAKDGLF
jgi:hypothetical protein